MNALFALMILVLSPGGLADPGPSVVGPSVVGPSVVGPSVVGPSVVGPSVVDLGGVGLGLASDRWIPLEGAAAPVSSPLAPLLLDDDEDDEEDDARPVKAIAPAPFRNLDIPSEWSAKDRSAFEEALKEFHGLRTVPASKQAKATKGLIRDFKRLVKKHKESPLPLYYLAILYQTDRDYPAARKVIKKALKMNKNFYEAYIELGDIDIWEKKPQDSIARYKKALSLYADYRIANLRLFTAYVQVGKYAEAKAVLEKDNEYGETPVNAVYRSRLESIMGAPNWNGETVVVETDNYIIKTNASQEFGEEVAACAERIRAHYDKMFPDIEKPDRKYMVFVFDSRASYLADGSPEQSGGYYDTQFRRLMLYKYPKLDDTFRVLKHEGFHQYCHEYLDYIPSWFNEGLADYFSTSRPVGPKGRQSMEIIPNEQRLRAVRRAIRGGREFSAERLMKMTQAQMYATDMGLNYAHGWSLVYFSIHGAGGKYRKVLVKYFKELRKQTPWLEVYKKTYGRVNMKQFEKEWLAYILKL